MKSDCSFTNKNIVQMAMPLISLSSSQWEELMTFEEEVVNPSLKKAVSVLLVNQARIEVMNKYACYYCDELEKPIQQESCKCLSIGA